MKLGIHIGPQNLPMDELRKAWRHFDDAGVDWISIWDHLYEAPPAGGTIDHFETVSTLGALCAETRNVRVGCLVFYVGYRNPALLAKTAASLDHLSGGRFELGLGAGWHEWEAQAYGYDFPSLGTRMDMLDESLQLVTSMLRNERTTFEGTHFRTDDVSNLPRPVQDHLPIWVGGIGEKRTLPMAARYADGWNAAYVSPQEFGRLNGVLDAACEAIDRDPASIRRTINVQFVVGADAADAQREIDLARESGGPMVDRVLAGAITGTVDTVAEQLAAYGEAGADGVNLALRAPWNVEALDGVLNDVLPSLR